MWGAKRNEKEKQGGWREREKQKERQERGPSTQRDSDERCKIEKLEAQIENISENRVWFTELGVNRWMQRRIYRDREHSSWQQ